jgi:putative transposase
MGTQNPNYRGYRFPPEIISYAIWLYHRFCLSFRDVEELLANRGVTVSYEAVRQWVHKVWTIACQAASASSGATG